MGIRRADTSRDMYREELRYVMGIVQQGVPWIDADENDGRMAQFRYVQRAFQHLFGSGASPRSPDAFKVVQADTPTNNFRVTGGGATSETAARYFIQGYQCMLYRNADYANVGANESESSQHPHSSALAAMILSDISANWAADELAGRTLTPKITDPTKFYTIDSNTENTITIASGNMLTGGAAAGDRYRIELSTPSADRTDAVYLNASLDEVNSDEDPQMKHTIDGPREAQIRYQIVQTLFVREDVPTWGEFTDYTDGRGILHYVAKLATLSRALGNSQVTTAMIADTRPLLSSFSDERVKVSATDIAAGKLYDKLTMGTGLDKAIDNTGGVEELRLFLTDAAASPYTPGTPGNWSGSPATLQAAIDRLAAWAKAHDGDPIP